MCIFHYRRKKVGVLATEKSKNNLYPKFNTPQMKSELVNFAKQIAPECAMPEVGFNVDGIIKHVQCFFNEQRRYRNRKPALEAHWGFIGANTLTRSSLLSIYFCARSAYS